MILKKFIQKIPLLHLLFYILILLLFFLYNDYVDLFIGIVIICCSIFIKLNNLMYLYLLLSFFDDVLILKYLGGSISRIILIVIILRSLYYIIKEKYEIDKKYISICLFFLISVIVSCISKTFTLECITIFINVFALVCLLIIMKNEKIETQQILTNIFQTILLSVCFACIYGIIHFNFLNEELSTLNILRFSGTYEPNFMCFYIDMAIISLLALSEQMNKYLYYILFSFLILFAGLTLSVTGIICLAIILLYYIVHKKFNKKEFIKVFIPSLIALLLFTPMNYLVSNMFNLSKITNEITIIENSIENPEANQENNTENNGNTLSSDNNTDNSIPEENASSNISEENASSENESTTEEKNSFEIRGEELKNDFFNGNWDKLTSGRLPLAKRFLEASFDRNIFQVLLGNGPTTKMLFTNFFYDYNYSHNSYMDLLYNFGIIGFILAIWFIINTIKNNYVFGNQVCNEYSWFIRALRILIILFGFGLSMYTKKMCLLILFI